MSNDPVNLMESLEIYNFTSESAFILKILLQAYFIVIAQMLFSWNISEIFQQKHCRNISKSLLIFFYCWLIVIVDT